MAAGRLMGLTEGLPEVIRGPDRQICDNLSTGLLRLFANPNCQVQPVNAGAVVNGPKPIITFHHQ